MSVASDLLDYICACEKSPPPVFRQETAERRRTLSAGNQLFIAASATSAEGETLFVARDVERFRSSACRNPTPDRAYDQEKQHLRALKRQLLLILVFLPSSFFSLMWAALYLAKQVTVPTKRLPRGTREVSSGNFDYNPEQRRRARPPRQISTP